jgi:SAM-dependent methyltransferase
MSDPIPAEARAANLALWNRWTRIHEKSAFYDVEGFLAGGTSLWPLEREELGPYVQEGTGLLHLQCHFGLDTLSWARLGARVVGLDLSDEAIALARRLAGQAGLSGRAEFICSDLYDADTHLGERLFDVVFVSWGAINWLPDLSRWAEIVARHLRPGGTLYVAEMHPFAETLDDEAPKGVLRVRYPYFRDPAKPAVDPVHGSYADPDADTTGLVAYYWQHDFAEILGALTGAGLRIEHLHEFPFSPSPFFDWMVQDEDRWWRLPADGGGIRNDLPFTFSLRATRPADEEA